GVARRRGSTTLGARRARGASRAGARGARLRPRRRSARADRRARLASARRARRFSARPQVTSELVYGRRAVREALRGPREVLELHASERALRSEAWLRDEPGLRLRLEPERVL